MKYVPPLVKTSSGQKASPNIMVILNIQQAAKFLGKTPPALRNGYKRWGVPHFRLGGQIKFTQEALQEWVAKNMTNGENTVGRVSRPGPQS